MEERLISGELEQCVRLLEEETRVRNGAELIKGLKVAVEQSIDGIAIYDKENRLTYVNKTYAEIRGYAPEEMIGMSAEMLHNGPSWYKLRRRKGEIDAENSWQGETWQKRKDGSLFPSYSSFFRLNDQDGNFTGVVSICRDMSKQHQALETLHESEKRYRTLFEKANDAILVVDLETRRILDINDQAERLLSRPRQEIIGMRQVEIHPPDKAEDYMDRFIKLVQQEGALEDKGEILRKDGRVIPISVSASITTLLGRQVVLSLFRDLTEGRRLSELKEKLTEKKLVEKAKRILVERYEISEEEALKRLQKGSRDQRKRIKYIASAVISSEKILE